MTQPEDLEEQIEADRQLDELLAAEEAEKEKQRMADWEAEKKWRRELGIPLDAPRPYAAIFARIKMRVPDRQWKDFIADMDSLGY